MRDNCPIETDKLDARLACRRMQWAFVSERIGVPAMKPERNPSTNRSNGARPVVSERGMALIMVVVILTSLLVLGTLFLQTAHLELKAATYFKSTNEAEIMAHSGFARATGELMYDVWGTNEIRPFVADRWSYFGPDSRSRDRFDNPVNLNARDPKRHIYTPMKLGQTFGMQGTGNGNGGFYLPDGESEYVAYKSGDGLEIDQIRSMTMRREKELYFSRPTKVMNVTSSAQKETSQFKALTDWDAWHIAEGFTWDQALMAGVANGTEGVGNDDIWQFGPARFHDAFLPRAKDVNDCWEYGLMINRIFKDSDGITVGMDRNYARDPEVNFGASATLRWPDGLEYTVGSVIERASNEWPWMYVDSHRICSDGFFRIFRSELVDETLAAFDANGNTVMGAYHLGTKSWPLIGATGPAININQVNNNYDYEFWHDHGKIDPWTNPLDNDAVRPDMYHYNEAKWIYIYDDAGNPRGRYAVTIHPDGGMMNINSFQDMQNYRKDYRTFANFNGSHFGTLENPFFMADQGLSVQGYSLNMKKGASVGGSVIHGNSENLGVNFFRVGWYNEIGRAHV